MTTLELQDRIFRGEDLHTEFKRQLIAPELLAAALVSFANTDGGQLILGVSDDGRIVGVNDPDSALRQVDNVARNNCEPPITIVQEVLEIGDKRVVLVNIPKGALRPYRTNQGVHYIRNTSGRAVASQEELLRLFQSSESLYYDETPLLRLTIADLDLPSFEDYLRRANLTDLEIEPEQLLVNWRLFARGTPTIAGILLFGRRPQVTLPNAQINAFRTPGQEMSNEPLDAKEIQGRLLDVIEGAATFLRLHLRRPHRIEGFEPEERPELPDAVLREAVVNAVAHRDYTVRGPVRIFVLDDRIEIRTPGKPPNTVDIAAMRSGVHVVRNPHMYSRLADAGLVTRAGSGVRRMSRLSREATGRDIHLNISPAELVLVIPRPAQT